MLSIGKKKVHSRKAFTQLSSIKLRKLYLGQAGRDAIVALGVIGGSADRKGSTNGGLRSLIEVEKVVLIGLTPYLPQNSAGLLPDGSRIDFLISATTQSIFPYSSLIRT